MRLLFVIVFLFSGVALAHPIEPSKIEIVFNKNGTFELAFQANLEAKLAGIGVKHKDTDASPQAQQYNELRQLTPDRLKDDAKRYESKLRSGMLLKFDNELATLNLQRIAIPDVGDLKSARVTTFVYHGTIPQQAKQVTWALRSDLRGNIVYMANEGDDSRFFEWTNAARTTSAFMLNERVIPQSTASIAAEYTVLGFEHILPLGLDHILFVIGLFLLSQRLKPLFWQVTAFTVAHSVTLTLTILGYISLSSQVIESLIALSIIYIAIENVLTKSLHAWRIGIVFLFGLLHGMGFASVLSDLGLPDYALLTALLSFNVGVELGQVAVLMLAFMVTFTIHDKPWFRQRVVIPISLLIAVIGLFWLWERTLA